MWDRLEKETGTTRDLVCLHIFTDEQCGETWQYMNSAVKDGRVVHEFRHRCGFGHRMRRHQDIPASEHYEAGVLR